MTAGNVRLVPVLGQVDCSRLTLGDWHSGVSRSRVSSTSGLWSVRRITSKRRRTVASWLWDHSARRWSVRHKEVVSVASTRGIESPRSSPSAKRSQFRPCGCGGSSIAPSRQRVNMDSSETWSSMPGRSDAYKSSSPNASTSFRLSPSASWSSSNRISSLPSSWAVASSRAAYARGRRRSAALMSRGLSARSWR